MSETVEIQAFEPIAIVGMACRFPGAPDVETFWNNLRNGVESVRFFTQEELRAAGVSPDLYELPDYVPAHGALEDVTGFDAGFFGISPREAEIIDPQHRLFLECAWEAIEHSGHNADRVGARFGVIAGVGLNAYLLRNILPRKDLSTPENFYSLLIAGDKDFLPSRVSYKLNLRGPSLNVNTACSTSLVAVHLACQQLWSYQCDAVLAGAVSLQVPQQSGYLYQAGGITSSDGHCRAFDESAAGTVPGSGVGAVVLKRLSDALAAGDTIHALIRGTASNNDGGLKAGFTAPGVEGQAAVISEAQAVAGVEPESIAYIEAHGTGTSLGDPIEISALTQAFGVPANDIRQFCRVGSVKTNIGHLDTAAGIAGLIKVVLMLKNEAIAPSLHFRKANSKIDFAASPFQLCRETTPWPRNGKARRAGISSFGLGGTNAHAVLEEAPAEVSRPQRSVWRLFPLSARNDEALYNMRARLVTWMETNREARLDDIAWTLAQGRKQFARVGFFVARSGDDLSHGLKRGAWTCGNRPDSPPRVAFLFPGQGAQQIGAGRDLYKTESAFRDALDECSQSLLRHGAADVRTLLFSDSADGGVEELHRTLCQTTHAQAVLFALGYALTALWKSYGVEPAAVLGHSSGEYAAAVCAGIMTLDDASGALTARACLMDRLPPGMMAAVALAESELRLLLPEGISIAAVNAADLCTVAGNEGPMQDLEGRLAKRNIPLLRLQTAHAFHSPAMDPVLDDFRAVLGNVALRPPALPFYSAVLGARASASQTADPDLWVRQLRETVRFGSALDTLLADGCSVLLEVGPGSTLTSLARRARLSGQVLLPGLPKQGVDEMQSVLTQLGQLWLAGEDINWPGLFVQDQPKRIPLPTYPFQRTKHWIEPALESHSASAAPPEHRDIADWFYLPSWTRSTPFLRTEQRKLEGNWLVLARDEAFDHLLIKHLERAGATVTAVLHSSVGNTADDYQHLCDRLEQDGNLPDRVLYRWNPDTASEAFNSLVWLVQAVTMRGHTPREIAVITSGLADVEGRESIDPNMACLSGPVAVIPDEFPGVACRLIDVEAAPGNPETLAANIVRELGQPAQARITAWRGRNRWLPQFDALRLPQSQGGDEPFRKGGTYLITGGIGGIGLILAEHLARTVHANLVLTSRRALPPPLQWDQRASRIRVSIEALEPQVSRMQAEIERELAIRTVASRDGLLATGNALASAWALRYLAKYGLPLYAGSRLTPEQIYHGCHAIPAFRRLVDHLLFTLEEDGWLHREADCVTMLRDAESAPDPIQLQTQACNLYPGMAAQFELLEACVKEYDAALSGQIPAISVLYPDGGIGRMAQAAERTEEHSNHRVYRTLLVDTLRDLASTAKKNTPLRILEVGGGNGILTTMLAPVLCGLPVEYVFTDVGPTFVRAAEAKAHELGYTFMRFATFDITRDPATQGFEPRGFDAVIGLDVIHATPSVRQTTENLRALLADGGVLCLVESARTHRWNDMVWGLAEGWWYFQDAELRNQNSPLLSTAGWERALEGTAFTSVLAFPRTTAERAVTDCSLVLAQNGAPPGDAIKEGEEEAIQALVRIRQFAGSLHVYQADVADRPRMEQVIAETEARCGRIHGVIHAAAIEHKTTISNRTRLVEEMEFRPKVDGTLVLDDLFRRRPLDFMVLCSSITSVVGGAGQAGYCAANAFLDAFACRRSRESEGLTVAINWGRWQGVGLARDFESWHHSRTGQKLTGGMTADEGFEALRRILYHGIAPQVAVMTEEWRPDRPVSLPVAVAHNGHPLNGTASVAKSFSGNSTEKQLATIWLQILGTSQFDKHTSFQELGGDSLVGIQMTIRIREHLGVQLPIHAIFDCPTIAALATRIEQETEEGSI